MTAMLPTEEDLHAYLDGELPEDRRSIVEAHLRDHPRDAKRLQAYRADGEAIARIFSRAGEAVRTPAPTALSRMPAVSMLWRRAAAIALIVAGTAAAGMLWQQRTEEARWARLGTDALAAHLSLDKVESAPTITVSLSEIAGLLTGALGEARTLNEPTGREFALVGSQVLTGANGPAAQLSFRLADGSLLTMFLQPWPRAQDTPFRPVGQQSNVQTLAWVDDEIFCAVSGTLPPDELERVARVIYKAILS
jgi:anti-sigma factor RsiW